MGNPQDHIADTLKTVRGTASDEDIKLIQDVVDLVIDGQDTTKSKNALESILSRGKKYGITVDSLYQDLLKSGVDPKEIEYPIYKNDKLEFLKKWLLPPHGPSHQMYTHKGWNHDYSPEDGDDWSGQAKNQSWEVKKKMLVDIAKKIYPSSDAEKIAVTLYNVHRLRDLQCNGTEKQKPGEHLKNIPDELEKFTLPLIKDENKKRKFAKEIADIRSEIKDYYENYFTKGFNEDINNPLYRHVDSLIGSLEGDNGGMLGDIYSETISHACLLR